MSRLRSGSVTRGGFGAVGRPVGVLAELCHLRVNVPATKMDTQEQMHAFILD